MKTSESVFQQLCNLEIRPGRVFFVDVNEFERNWDISGIIGLSGDVSGAVVISFKENTACQVTRILTGKEHDDLDKLVCDTTGEIINIIAGNVKKYYENELRIKISLPSIVKGKAHCIVWPSDKARIICIPFSIFEDQEICISVAMAITK
jgi:chemotaxis protein CheX